MRLVAIGVGRCQQDLRLTCQNHHVPGPTAGILQTYKHTTMSTDRAVVISADINSCQHWATKHGLQGSW